MLGISIIMPLYNAEKYLRETLISIRKQSFIDYELICINDASSDTTMEILRHFQREDDRIRIISNSGRCGAAISRNKGMLEATGKYLSFLDGDDIFVEDMLECAYKAAEEHQTDIIMFEERHVSNEEIYNRQKVIHSEAFYKRYCSEGFGAKERMPYEFTNWNLSLENRLYLRAFIVENQITFQDLPCSNDVYFSCMAMLLSERLLFLDDNRVMVYKRDHNEPTRISYDRDPKCCYLAFLYIAEELKKRDKFIDFYMQYYYLFFYNVRIALLQCKSVDKEKAFYRFLQEEGIDAIRSVGEEYYDKLGDYIKGLLEQFKKQDFDSKWYRIEQGLKLQLSQKCHAETVINLFRKYEKLNKTIGIWGCGANGISFLEFCRKNDLSIDMVVDKSKEKQGQTVHGYLIEAPEDIGDKLQVVIVTTRYVFKNVMEELVGQNIEVIDINQHLWVY